MTLTPTRPDVEIPDRPAPTGRRRSEHRSPGRTDIEGLRALAIALVVVYHAGIGRLTGGYVGVDIFFVISGFLITGLLLREFESTSRISISAFYARRLRRIVPASALTLIATVVASGLLLGAVRIGAIALDGLWSSAFMANFRFIASGTDYLTSSTPPSPLQHFWSLAVEEQFYIVWPALLWLLLVFGRRFGGRVRLVAGLSTAALVVVSLVWCVRQTTSNGTMAYFSPWTRAWELGVGALIAISLPLWARLPRAGAFVLGWIGLAGILTSAYFYTPNTTFPGIAAALPVAGVGLMIAAGSAQRQMFASPGTLLGIKPLQFIGGLSYTIYLWHWPILIIAEQRYPWINSWIRAGLVAGAVALSYVTHRLIENPIRFAPVLVANRTKAIAVGLAITVAAAAFTNAYVVMDRGRVDSAQATAAIEQASAGTVFIDPATVRAAVAAAPKITRVPAKLRPPLVSASDDGGAPCYYQQVLGAGKVCYLGDRNAKNLVVLYGDSHAGMWSYPLATIASRAHFKLVMLIHTGCPSPTLHMWSYVTKAPDTACDQWHDLATAKINELNPSMVIETSAGYAPLTPDKQPISGPDWKSGLVTALQGVSKPGRALTVIGDIPYLKQAAATCLSVNSAHVQSCSLPLKDAYRSTYRDAEKAAALQVGARYIDPTPWLCSSICTPVISDFLVYKDQYHLTSLYASYLASSIAQAMRLGG